MGDKGSTTARAPADPTRVPDGAARVAKQAAVVAPELLAAGSYAPL